MTASRELKTPTMSVPLSDLVSEKEATKLTRSFQKLTLDELIVGHQGVSVRETLIQDDGANWQRAYYVSLHFHPAERIKTAFGISLQDIAKVVAKTFVPALAYQMKMELRRSSTEGEGVISVEGGESTAYVSYTKDENDDDSQTKANSGSKLNLFDDEDDDDNDDESADGMDVEDGVVASRSQQQSYGEKDDEEKSTSSMQSSVDSDDDDGDSDNDDNTSKKARNDDAKKHSSFDFSVTNSLSSVKVDSKRNTIHLKPLQVDPAARPLLMVGLVEKAACKTLVRSRKNIDAAYINDEEGRGRCLQTAGINFSELWKLENIDYTRLVSNDIWAIRCAYGVEAARNTIVDQIRSVFGVYGIEVDPRHLSLIADYMTFSGGYTAMNRTGMREMSSPFLQMSFETTAQFLTQAAVTASSDKMESPSANIVVGRPIRQGTGAFSLLVK
jgi:DNA-directed RNA polymerase I subunit RPA1